MDSVFTENPGRDRDVDDCMSLRKAPARSSAGPQAVDWRRALDRLAPLALPLLPCGAGAEGKGPIDARTGNGLSRWQTARFTVAEIAAMNGVVRSVGSRTGAGLVCFDIDGATALELALEQGCDPQQAQTWQVHRDTDPCRLKVLWRLSAEQQAELGAECTSKAHTQAPRRPGEKGEAIELFHHPRRQVLLLGQHVPSQGHYVWPDGMGPEALAPITPAWWALAKRIAAKELGQQQQQQTGTGTGTTRSKGSSNSKEWRPADPCPICGRRSGRDRAGSFCSRNRNSGGIRCFHGSTFSPELSHGVLKVGETVAGTDGVVYGFCGTQDQDGHLFSKFVVHQEREPRAPRHDSPAVLRAELQDGEAQEPQQDGATQQQAQAPTFAELWAALEAHADEVILESWPLMKAVASLSNYANELGLHRLTARNFEQLLEAAHRRARPAAIPLIPGAAFTVRATPWAVDGLIRHGVNLLVGQPGSGKSRLSAAAIAAWLRGDQTWLGREMPCDLPAEQRHALIIGTDQPLEDWALTLEPVGLAERLGPTEARLHPRLTLHTLETGTLLDADGLATIRRWCDDHPHGVVMVDSLAACLPPGIDEDKSAAARPVHALAEAIGSCWAILTHHTRKGAGKDQNLGIGAGRGSGALDAAVSRVIGLGLIHKMENGILTPQESDPRRELLSTKRGGATLHLIVRSDSTGFWSNEGSADDLKRQERRERTIAGLTDAQASVLDVLEEAGGWLTGRQVVEGLLEPGEEYDNRGALAASTRKILSRLETLGLLETQKVGRDRMFRLTAAVGGGEQESQESSLARDEGKETGSNCSNAAAQGISPALMPALPGSGRLYSPAEPGEPPSPPEPLEPVRAAGEQPVEQGKPLAPQHESQESNPPFPTAPGTPCSVDGQPGWRLPGALPRSGGKKTRVLVISPAGASQTVELERITLAAAKAPPAPQPDEFDEDFDEFAA